MISRRLVVAGLAGAAAATVLGMASMVPPYRLRAAAQVLGGRAPAPQPLSGQSFSEPADWALRLIEAAEAQVGRTLHYDPACKRLAYPMGDVADDRGVCTDVIIRAYRSAFDIDLQKLVHEDMEQAFDDYPKSWGLQRPDANIDHRRVPNLERFFERRGAGLAVSDAGAGYRPGDIVTQRLPGNLPHIAIVTNRPSGDGARPLVVHNIGAGVQVEDTLFAFRIVRHFRFPPELA